MIPRRAGFRRVRPSAVWTGVIIATLLTSCQGRTSAAREAPDRKPVVSVVRVDRKALERNLTVSSELVPFEQIDVYAKESGFVRTLNVDYGTRVKAGDVLAILEIPELQIQLDEDQADIRDASSQVDRARQELSRVEAEHDVTSLEFARLNDVAKSRPGMVAQQEVDDRRGKDLAAQAQVAAATAAVASEESRLAGAQAKLRRHQTLYNYSKITAPFTGVITNRYANLGTLVQTGMNSSTQAMPVVQLSQDELFRLVIPVPESYVPYIRVGDPVDVRVPSLHKSFPGKVARCSVDVEASTRTMHTEVDVPNPAHVLVPGAYAEATLILDRKTRALAIPPEAVNIQGDQRTVWVVDPSGVLQSRPVTVGIETPDDVEIVSGLMEGEMVAVGDRTGLKAGEAVRPKQIELLRYHAAQKPPGN